MFELSIAKNIIQYMVRRDVARTVNSAANRLAYNFNFNDIVYTGKVGNIYCLSLHSNQNGFSDTNKTTHS